MSRKKRKKKPVITAMIQGRTLRSIRKIRLLDCGRWGEFVYRKKVYQIEHFPPHGDINLETAPVDPIRDYEGSAKQQNRKNKKKNKGKKVKVNYIAKMYSNIDECPDVGLIYEPKD